MRRISGWVLPLPFQPSVIGWGTRITAVTATGWKLGNSPSCP